MQQRPVVGAIATALLVVLGGTSPVQATSWSAPVVLTARQGAGSVQPLASTGPRSAVVAYDIGDGGSQVVEARRTADGGKSWFPPVTLSTPGVAYAGGVSLAASGQVVLALFDQGDGCVSGAQPPTDCTLWLARSIDGGTTFAPAVSTGPATSTGLGSVAIEGSLAVIAWSDLYHAVVKVRVSTDAGANFGTASSIGSTMSSLFAFDGVVTAAVSAGALVVVWQGGPLVQGAPREWLELRRSLDDGATWRPIKQLAAAADFQHVLAVGHSVLVSYVSFVARHGGSFPPHLIRSTDRGATWSSPALLSPLTEPDANEAMLAYGDGRYRAIFGRCVTNGCHDTNTYIRSSRTGKGWTKATQVGPEWAPIGVTAGRTIIVAFQRGRLESELQLIVRVGSP